MQTRLMQNLSRLSGTTAALVLLSGATLTSTSAAIAQDNYPARAVRMVIPYPPGGPTDLAGRMVGQRLSERWKQPVIVDNRAGASGSIGSDFVAKSAPDGYTLVLGNNSSHGAYELLHSNSPYRTLRDFAPIALFGITPLIMITRSSLDVKNIKEYVAYAKSNAGKLNYASAGIGSSPHFGAELLNLVAGIRVTHVPFNGTAPAMTALLSASVDSYMGGYTSVIGQVKDGRARIMGIVGAQRTEQLPDVPTLREQGFPVEYDAWYGLLAPVAVPPAILDRINADTNSALGSEENKLQLLKLGFERKLSSRADFAALLVKEGERTQRIIREASIKVD
jgi:tripartite-type tricarboxylate transporter receptor subunit TctC